MKCFYITLLASLAVAVSSQHAPQTTPVPILKQINKQNDDGSYSFGYEAADGSFKIETKYPNGDVAGKYGYVDANGKPIEISYGASSKGGFQPQGAGIVVPPPSLHEPPSNALTEGDVDDGQYREDPKIYEDPKYNSKVSTNFRQTKQPIFQQFHSPSTPQQAPQYSLGPQAAPAQQFQQVAQPQYQPQPQYQSQQQYQPHETFPSFPNFGQNRPQSLVYHQSPKFSYQAVTPQQQVAPQQFDNQYTQPEIQPQPQYQSQPRYQPQPQYQQSQYQPQNYYQPESYQQFNPFAGHPAQNFDPSSGSYSINYSG